jgi:hypothetical protein
MPPTARQQRPACRVIAQAICVGTQERKVMGYTAATARSGQPYISVRVGQVLIYIEDRAALASFIDAFSQAHRMAERVFPFVDEQRQSEARRQAIERHRDGG